MVLAILASLSEVPLTLTAPRPRPRELDEIEQIEALIEEARRHARRRRFRNGAVAVVLALGGALLLLSRGSDAPVAGPASQSADAGGAPVLDRAALPAAGEITLIGLPVDEKAANRGVEGWFEMSVLDSSGRLRPFLPCPADHSYCGVVEGIDWSADGRKLAFTVGAHGASNPFIGLHVLDVPSGEDRRVIDGNVCRGVVRSDLAWSPDGGRLAYVCERASGGGRALVLFEPGRGVRELPTGTTGRVSSPTWSPEGGRIAFAVAVPKGTSHIVSMRLDGSERSVVARDGTAPDWSPGGTIAYRASCGGVKLVTPEGRDVTPVRGPFPCRAIGVPGTPVWSPDGEWLAIGNRSGIYLVNRDGSRLRRLTQHTGIGHHGGRPTWRPVP